jgi:hypothetical protein
MAASDQTTEEREQELTARLKLMEQQLERLTARLGDENSPTGTTSHATAPVASQNESEYPAEDIADVSEEVLNWATRTALLPRLATLCFLMVVALIFRTVTDSGIVSKLIGSALGMSYASILIVASWYYFSKQSLLAPVFAACGAILMSSIVVETHTHFNSLPLIPAYATLVVTGIVMAIISRRFDAFTPISVGTLAMCFAGAAIDYPNPFFPYLSLVLFAANVLAYFAAQMKRCGWLRWSVLIVSMFMLQLWGFRLGNVLRRGEIPAPDLAYSWFLPVVAIFAATYFAFALCGILFREAERISRFDAALPTISTLWAFSTAYYVVNAAGGGTGVLGIAGTFIAVGLLALSFWLAQRSHEGSPGAGTFFFASGVMLALALPVATGKAIFSLPIISMVAIFMAVVSRSWGSGTVRFATYLFHIYSSIAIAILLKGSDATVLDAVNILPTGLLAVIILYQYQWCRWWPPAAEYSFFDRFDTHDRSAVLLLLGGLLSGFFTLRCTIYQILQLIPGTLSPDVFRCSQSVLINVAVIVLIVLAYLHQDKTLRNVAIFVTIVGGVKVFAYDLLGTHGLPLVFSVFSFGVAAAAESVALGKWPKKAVAQVVAE